MPSFLFSLNCGKAPALSPPPFSQPPNSPQNSRTLKAQLPQLDAVSKAFGLIVRRINDEPFEQASVPGSRAVTIRFIVPHTRMGSVIGKGGAKIKEIQEASGARLNAGEQMLPGSTEVSPRRDNGLAYSVVPQS